MARKKKHPNKGKVCIEYRKRKPRRCKRFGTKAEAKRRGLL